MSATDACAIVLCGGLGTRLRAVCADRPKVLAPVRGRPFLAWILDYLQAQGVRRVVLSLGYRAQDVVEYLRADPRPAMDLAWAVEPEPLGTAGGLSHAAGSGPGLPSRVSCLNGDSLVLVEMSRVASLFDESGADVVLVGRRVADCSRFGSLSVDPQGRLLAFREKIGGAGLINAGVYVIRREVLAELPGRRPLSLEREVFPELLAAGAHMQVLETDAPFIDIGTPESLGRADEFVLDHGGAFEVTRQGAGAGRMVRRRSRPR